MTLKERLDKANQESVALYLRRQQIESQKQQIARMAAECDQQLIGLDAQIAMLTELTAENQPKDAPTSADISPRRRVRQPRLVPRAETGA